MPRGAAGWRRRRPGRLRFVGVVVLVGVAVLVVLELALVPELPLVGVVVGVAGFIEVTVVPSLRRLVEARRLACGVVRVWDAVPTHALRAFSLNRSWIPGAV
jgi:hypothetical protein